MSWSQIKSRVKLGQVGQGGCDVYLDGKIIGTVYQLNGVGENSGWWAKPYKSQYRLGVFPNIKRLMAVQQLVGWADARNQRADECLKGNAWLGI